MAKATDASARPGLEPGLCPRSTTPGFPPCCVGPLHKLSPSQSGDPGGEGTHSLWWLWLSRSSLPCPEGNICTGSSPTRFPLRAWSHVYIVHTQCLGPASSSCFPTWHSLPTAGEEERPCLTPPTVLHPFCPGSSGSKPQGPVGSKQQLGLPYFVHWIQLVFCITFLWHPHQSWGPAGRPDSCNYFHTFPTHLSWDGGPAPSTQPLPLEGECVLHVSFAMVGVCLIGPYPLLDLQECGLVGEFV